MKGKLFFRGLACLLVVLVLGSVSFAQQVPVGAKPGAVEKSLEKPAPTGEPSTLPELTTDEGKERKIEGDATFLLEDVAFKGNNVFSYEELRALIETYIGKTIAVKTLQEITDILTNHYKNKGFLLSRAYIPPQSIKNKIIIGIREGRLGEIIVNGNDRYKTKIFEKTLYLIRDRGAINIKDIERGLLLLMDVPGLSVKATFKAGTEPGTSDIIIDADESFPVTFGLDYNNYGTDYLSKHRFGASVSAFNIAGIGDILSLRAVSGNEGFDGLIYTRGEYVFPIGYSGFKMGLYYQYLDYELGEEYEQFDYKGTSSAAGGWWSYPIKRSRQWSWWVDGGLDARNYKTELLGTEASDEKIRPLFLGSTLYFQDKFWGTNNVRLKWSNNTSELFGGTKNDDPEALINATDMDYNKLEFEYTRYQRFQYDLGLIFSFGGQLSVDRLPSSEDISLGGVGTVRGYELNELSGDVGLYTNAEFRIPLYGTKNIRWFSKGKTLYETLSLAAFADYGRLYINDARDAFEDDLDGSNMFGAGLGLRFTYSPYAQIKLDYAKSLGGEDPRKESVDDNGIFYIQASFVY